MSSGIAELHLHIKDSECFKFVPYKYQDKKFIFKSTEDDSLMIQFSVFSVSSDKPSLLDICKNNAFC
jgi:hypothetical protein